LMMAAAMGQAISRVARGSHVNQGGAANSWATLLMAVSSQMAARAAKVGRMGVGCR